jgi:hypothetical protein
VVKPDCATNFRVHVLAQRNAIRAAGVSLPGCTGQRRIFMSLVLALFTWLCFSQAPRYLTIGVFIGSPEEGARMMTPTQLLPFEHPDALNHEFPTALIFHTAEFETLVLLGERSGLKLRATLQRYPRVPGEEWKYQAYALPPVEALRAARVDTLGREQSPLVGLRAVAYRDRQPLAFIVDTRDLTLAQRGMQRATAAGLDITRAQLLSALSQRRAACRSVAIGWSCSPGEAMPGPDGAYPMPRPSALTARWYTGTTRQSAGRPSSPD